MARLRSFFVNPTNPFSKSTSVYSLSSYSTDDLESPRIVMAEYHSTYFGEFPYRRATVKSLAFTTRAKIASTAAARPYNQLKLD